MAEETREEKRLATESARLVAKETRLAKELAKELAMEQVRPILLPHSAGSHIHQEKVMKTIKTGDFVR